MKKTETQRQDKLYHIIGLLTNNKFQITVRTYRIVKETNKTVSYYTQTGKIKKINKSKLQEFESFLNNQNGYYGLNTYTLNKKYIQTYIDALSLRIKSICADEYFKVIDSYKLSLKKPSIKKDDLSGKLLDDTLDLLNKTNDYGTGTTN